MKKTAIHFKIAAWSIKNPMAFYAMVGSTLVVLLVVLLMLGRASMSTPQKNSVAVTRGTTPGGIDVSASGTPPVWVSGAEFRQAPNLRCLERKREDTGYRVFSCYENVNGKWVFKHNL